MMTDCVTAPQNQRKPCQWDVSKSDIFDRLDDIKGVQTQTNAMLGEHMPAIRHLPKVAERVGIMWGAFVTIGSIISVLLVGALFALIIKGT